MTRGTARHGLATVFAGFRELLSVRLIRWVAVLLVVALIVRAGLEFALSTTINRLVADRDLVCEWEDLDLSVISGRGELHRLALRPKSDGEIAPLLELEYAVFDLDVLRLLRGELSIGRAEVDGLDASLERAADGTWNLSEHLSMAELLELMESPAEVADAQVETQTTEPLDLAPPLSIGALRFQSAACRIVDEAVEPRVDLTFRVNASLSDLNDPDRPARFAATIHGGGLVDAAHLEGDATWTEEELALSLRAQAGSIRPRRLSVYLEPLGLRPAAEMLEAQLLADLRLSVTGEARDVLTARAELSELRLIADGTESMALDRFAVELESLSSERASLPGIEIAGVRGRASIESDGALRVAGIDLTSTKWVDALSSLSASADPQPETTSGTPAWLSLLFEENADAYEWSLGSLQVRDCLFDLTDRTIEPHASFPFHVDNIHVGEVAHVADKDHRTIPIEAGFRAPGMAESIAVNGTVGPFAPKRSVELELNVDGIVLESLEGHMQRVGVERSLQRGSFRARLVGEATTDASGRSEGHLALDRIALQDEGQLFGVESIAATGLVIDPAERLLRFGNIEVAGTQLSMGRDPSRHFFAFGLRSLGFTLGGSAEEGAEEDAAGPSSDPSNAPMSTTPPTRIELGRLAWLNNDVEFVDLLTEPPRRFELEQLSIELQDLTLGGTEGDPIPDPARFTASVVAPGMFDTFAIEGTVLSRPGPIDLTAEFTLQGSGGTGELIAPYVRTLGVEPMLQDADLELGLRADVKEAEDGWLVAAAIQDVALSEGDSVLLSCEELRVDDLFVGDTFALGSIELRAPRVNATMDPSGQLILAGVGFVDQVAPPVALEESEGEAPATFALPELPPFELERAAITGARFGWTDASLTPELATELVLDFTATDVSTGGAPSAFEAVLQVPDTLERLRIAGELSLGDDVLGLRARLDGDGVSPGPLTRLLPPEIEVDASEAKLRGELTAELRVADEGGMNALLDLRDWSWGDDDEDPWFALTSARASLLRFDPAAGLVRLGPLTIDGARLAIERDGEGALHALGMRIGGDTNAPVEAIEVADAPGATIDTPDVAAPIVLPRIELAGDIDLELERFRYRDASFGPGALPIDVAGILRVETPLVAVAADAAALEPIRWSLQGAVAGLIERWSFEGELAPFADEPRFEAQLLADGIRTAGLVERIPSLAPSIAGDIEEGTFAASSSGTLFVRRTRPTDLGLSRPFSADFRLHGVELRDRPNGRVLAGVERVTAEVGRVDPASGLVRVDLLEILRPRGAVKRDDTKLYVLGLVIDTAPVETSAQTPSSDPAPPVAVEASASTPDESEADAAFSSEFRIDQILVSGLDFEFRDETTDPPIVVPLTELDVEVKRFTTRALEEKRPIHFSAFVGARATNDEVPIFEELAVSGRVALYPEPAGWAQVALTGLELIELAPLAAANDLTIDDGSLDASLRLRLKGNAGTQVDSTLAFTDLSMEEPEGGLIERTLSLPMALDTALFLLKNAEGEHRFSAGFTVDDEGVSGSDIAVAATRAFTEVLARALASVPFRMLGGFIPGGDKDKGPRPAETWPLAFDPASTEIAPWSADIVEAAAKRLEASRSGTLVLSHELTPADIERAELLANPPESTCRELVLGLRKRKDALLELQRSTATEAQALYAIGDRDAAQATEALRELERELATIEDSLDDVLEILRSNSPRKRLKRTRATARELAELRLEAVFADLQRRLRKGDRGRVEIRSPRFEVTERTGGGRVVVELRER